MFYNSVKLQWRKAIQQFQRYVFLQVWTHWCQIWQVSGPLASQYYGANGQMTLKLHNYIFRWFHETLNGDNPSSDFRDMCSSKFGQMFCLPTQESAWNNTHYNDIIMTTMASQITSLAVVYSIVYSGADQRKHQSSASLAFVREIHRDQWIPRTKGQ